MSGSSGGGYSGRRGSTSLNCDDVSVRGTINSPDPAVLATLTVGNTLSIIVRTVTGPLLAVTEDGRMLGSVFVATSDRLIECISEGNTFTGEIISITGAHCVLLITNE